MTDAKQFDERYRLDPQRSEDTGARKRSRFVADQQRRLQAELTRRPSNIAFFENLLSEPGPADGKPLIGYFCNMIPVELIMALDARPIRLGCGNPALVQQGEEVLSGEICPLAKSSFATFLDAGSPANRCGALILPSSCDAKRKLGEVLADYKPTFMFNLPPEQDAHRFAPMAAAEVDRLADWLSKQLNRRLKRSALMEAISLTQRRAGLVRRLQEARASKPAALSVRDLFVIIQSASAGGNIELWLAETEKVLLETEAFEPPRKRFRPRIVLTGAPMIWPNFKVLNLIEEARADVVADTLCTGAEGCFDPVVYEAKGWRALMRALAERYIFASPCPCFISQGTRISRVLELVEEYKADGVINYGLRLCQLFDMEAYRLSRILKQKKVAFINIRTDYSLEDTEQIRVRLEAFLETVEKD